MSTQLTNQDIAGLEAWLEKWKANFSNADWDSLMDIMTDDVVWLPPDEPVIEGKKAARAKCDEWPSIKDYSAQFVSVDGRDDFAWTRSTFTGAMEVEPGTILSMHGKWTATFRKQADGSWLMTSDIWNFDSPVGG